MSAAKDLLAIVNACVVTVDAVGTIVNDASIVVGADGKIRAIASGAVAHTSPTVIDAKGGIVMPGMINAHTHMGMTLFRGLGDDMNLEDFLGRLMPAEIAVLSHEAVVAGTELGALESLLGGITTALDMYYLPDAALDVAKRSGMRIHCGPNLLESDGPEPLPFAQRMAWANEWLTESSKREQEFSLVNGFDSLNWLSPHSTYLLGEDHLHQISALAKNHGAHIHVHAAETVGEMSLVAKRHGGRTPISVLADTQLLSNAVLAHGVHLNDADIALIAKHGASVTHCPASNYKLASGTARIVELHNQGVNVALGTDGPASGNDLDLWLAMRLAGYVQKTAATDPTVLPALDVLRMATINGARALHIDHLVGSLEVGKFADLVVLDAFSPSLTPVFDPHVAIVAAAGRGDVCHVVVNGQVVVRDRTALTIDAPAIVKRVNELTPAILASVARN
ncbi:MAG: amidohydrolase [Actinobacteria bacterium]|nr:MAG: amidohydrolase [Actinomycetota bacterium]